MPAARLSTENSALPFEIVFMSVKPPISMEISPVASELDETAIFTGLE